MARSEARISVAIWDDDDFIALDRRTQGSYFFLLSQRDLAHTGVLPLRERRWIRKAGEDLTDASLAADLNFLAATRFIVIDEDTGELLIRSLIRRDKIYRQPNVLRAAADHLSQIESPIIRAELLAEMLRIEAADDVPKQSAPIVAEMIEALRVPPNAQVDKGSSDAATEPTPVRSNPSGNPSGNPPPNPTDGGSGNPRAQSPGERGVVTAVSRDSPFPVPRDLPPPAGDASRAEPELPPDGDEPTAQTLLGEYLRGCRKRPPGQVTAQLGKVVKAMLAEGIDPDDIRAAFGPWSAKGLHPSSLPSVVNEVMNSGGTARASPGNAVELRIDTSRRPSTTDQRVTAALNLAAQLDQEAS